MRWTFMAAVLASAAIAGCGGAAGDEHMGRGLPSGLRFATGGWRTDFSDHSVPLDQFASGGPGKDGIPRADRGMGPRGSGLGRIVCRQSDADDARDRAASAWKEASGWRASEALGMDEERASRLGGKRRLLGPESAQLGRLPATSLRVGGDSA
jgi:hypothetical protein